MAFRIEVHQFTGIGPDQTKPSGSEVKIYEQVVEDLDLRAVVNAVMAKKRGPRAAPKAKP